MDILALKQAMSSAKSSEPGRYINGGGPYLMILKSRNA